MCGSAKTLTDNYITEKIDRGKPGGKEPKKRAELSIPTDGLQRDTITLHDIPGSFRQDVLSSEKSVSVNSSTPQTAALVRQSLVRPSLSAPRRSQALNYRR